MTHSVRISIKRAVNSRHLIQDGRLYKNVKLQQVVRTIIDSSDDESEPSIDIAALEKNKVMKDPW